jgi:guanylate kinase
MSKSRGLLFVFVGPGGAGKNTLMNIIKERHPEIQQLATATTREMRAGEQQGRERIFVSLERFRDMISNDELLEFQEVTPNKYYGIPRASVEEPMRKGIYQIADIEVRGAQVLMENWRDDIVILYVTAPGKTEDEQLETIKQRMLQRLNHAPTQADWDLIHQRLERAKNLEFPFSKKCEHIIINDKLDDAVEQVDKIIIEAMKKRKKQS